MSRGKGAGRVDICSKIPYLIIQHPVPKNLVLGCVLVVLGVRVRSPGLLRVANKMSFEARDRARRL